MGVVYRVFDRVAGEERAPVTWASALPSAGRLTRLGDILGSDFRGAAIDVRAEVRTGDTTAAQRQALIKTPPHILVTTPESLYLLLTSDSGRGMLHTARTLILDENTRRVSSFAFSNAREL